MSTAFVGAGLCLSQVSTGGTIDRPHFNVDGIAIVWALIGVAVNNITRAPVLGALALIGAVTMGVTAWRCRETI